MMFRRPLPLPQVFAQRLPAFAQALLQKAIGIGAFLAILFCAVVLSAVLKLIQKARPAKTGKMQQAAPQRIRRRQTKPRRPRPQRIRRTPQQPGERLRLFRQQPGLLQTTGQRAQTLPTPPQRLAALPGLPTGRAAFGNAENTHARIQQTARLAVLVQPHQRRPDGSNPQIHPKSIVVPPSHKKPPNSPGLKTTRISGCVPA